MNNEIPYLYYSFPPLIVLCIVAVFSLGLICNRTQTRNEAVKLKFASYEKDGFQWNTNATTIIIKAFEAENTARELNGQSKELMCLTIKAMKTILDTGTLCQQLQSQNIDANKTKKQKKE